MRTVMLGLLAETPIHPGAGRGMGVVDLPVAREAATDYPVLVGSSLKGALRDKMEMSGADDPRVRFGKPDRAGDLLVSDARLLLLPVRSLTGSYRWATCPHLVERYRRDLARAGVLPVPPMPEVGSGSVLAAAGKNHRLFLEERQFRIVGEPEAGLVQAVEPTILHEETRARVASRVAILADDDFTWFVRYGLSIQARNELDGETKASRNLWYEETLPPDTVMYALVAGRGSEAVRSVGTLFGEDPYLQVGGNETVGQGWFAVTVRGSSEDSLP